MVMGSVGEGWRERERKEGMVWVSSWVLVALEGIWWQADMTATSLERAVRHRMVGVGSVGSMLDLGFLEVFFMLFRRLPQEIAVLPTSLPLLRRVPGARKLWGSRRQPSGDQKVWAHVDVSGDTSAPCPLNSSCRLG